jgi:hypothetical protein
MIAIDALLLLNCVLFAILLWMLLRSLGREKELRKGIEDLLEVLNKRTMLITRLLHEVDKRGSDDAELLSEAKAIAMAVDPVEEIQLHNHNHDHG